MKPKEQEPCEACCELRPVGSYCRLCRWDGQPLLEPDWRTDGDDGQARRRPDNETTSAAFERGYRLGFRNGMAWFMVQAERLASTPSQPPAEGLE